MFKKILNKIIVLIVIIIAIAIGLIYLSYHLNKTTNIEVEDTMDTTRVVDEIDYSIIEIDSLGNKVYRECSIDTIL